MSNKKIVLLILFTCVCLFLRSINHVFVSDEVSYHFMMPEKGSSASINMERYLDYPQIHSFSEVIVSTYRHHMQVNGRTPVHFIEYLFSGVIGSVPFFVLNIIVFYLLVQGLINLCVPKELRNRYLVWLLTLIILLYLYPEQFWIWTSINLSPNYLWSSALVVWFIYKWNHIRNDENKKINIWWIIIAFFAGWSHEGFALPVAFALVVYYCFNRKSLKMCKAELFLVVAFAIGIICLLSSPGNYIRASKTITDESLCYRIFSFLRFILGSKTFIVWIVVMSIGLYFNKHQIRKYLIANCFYFAILCGAAMLVFVVRTGLRSFMMGDIACTFMILPTLCGIKFFTRYNKPRKLIVILLSFVYVMTQSFAVYGMWTYNMTCQELVRRYKASKDGVFILPQRTKYSFDYIEDIVTIDENYGRYPGATWATFQVMYNCYQKPYLPVTAVDYAAIKQPELFYIPHNRIKGNLPLYHRAGSNNVWMHPDSTVMLNPNMRITEYKVDGKLYRMFKLEAFEYFQKHER